MMSQFQRNQIVKEFDKAKEVGFRLRNGLVYKAAKYIRHQTKAAFVSTNSIVQNKPVFYGDKCLISMALKFILHTVRLKWSNEAKGNAAVYCVIIGFVNFNTYKKEFLNTKISKEETHE